MEDDSELVGGFTAGEQTGAGKLLHLCTHMFVLKFKVKVEVLNYNQLSPDVLYYRTLTQTTFCQCCYHSVLPIFSALLLKVYVNESFCCYGSKH